MVPAADNGLVCSAISRSSDRGWSRDKADDGQLDSIIANGILQGPGSVSVTSSDKFVEYSGDCTRVKQ